MRIGSGFGNGFFSDTREEALRKMEKLSGCKVVKSNYPSVGNRAIYVSEHGDYYTQRHMKGGWVTRIMTLERRVYGYVARIKEYPRQTRVRMNVLIYCAFVLHEWQPDIELEYKNGNQFDLRPENLQLRSKVIPSEWSDRMKEQERVYAKNFNHVCNVVRYYTMLDTMDCEDAVQQAFIYLCTDGFKLIRHKADIVGVWVNIARFRAIEYFHHVTERMEYGMLDTVGKSDRPYELDLFDMVKGEKRRLYTRLYFEGNTPSEIAVICGADRSTVSESVSRAVQKLRKRLQADIYQHRKI